MNTIRQIGIELNAESRESFEVGLRQTLRTLGRRLQKVNAFISDLNGPKGGIHRQCRVVVHLKRQSSLMMEERSDELAGLNE